MIYEVISQKNDSLNYGLWMDMSHQDPKDLIKRDMVQREPLDSSFINGMNG